MQSTDKKTKRIRLTEIKKWSYEETSKILDYVLQTGKLEKPTAQLYYRKLIDETGIDATWTMVRWKMRNLKTSFSKCNEWRKSTKAGLVEGEDRLTIVHAKILKMCPHYDRLQEIFGEKRSALEVQAYEFTNCNVVNESEQSDLNETMCEVYAMDSKEQPHISTQVTLETATESFVLPKESTADLTPKTLSTAKETSRFAEKLTRNAPKTSIQKLIALHSERNQLNNKKLVLEQKKFDKEVERDEKRHKLETLKIELEEKKLKWDQEKFQSEQELKFLQLQKEERIAMFEIEMKYKNNR